MTNKEWALKLSEMLSEADFTDLVDHLETCDDVDFWNELAAIDTQRRPELYSDIDDLELVREANAIAEMADKY